ncbi:MAG: uncharacterized protein A8A55_1572 [Amphiamblys sp. WSBS2006]|nr:MAG: uncharacterized protein A8A55_1572 [Amphiamblys sp. WSBS2006]
MKSAFDILVFVFLFGRCLGATEEEEMWFSGDTIDGEEWLAMDGIFKGHPVLDTKERQMCSRKSIAMKRGKESWEAARKMLEEVVIEDLAKNIREELGKQIGQALRKRRREEGCVFGEKTRSEWIKNSKGDRKYKIGLLR